MSPSRQTSSNSWQQHISLHLLDGRNDAQKTLLSEALLARILPLLPEVISVGVEIIDMHRTSYRKRVLGG